MLATGELWPSKRVLADEVGAPVPGETPMEGVEHLGQYVFEMTNAKVQQLRAERGLPETALLAPVQEQEDEDEVEADGYIDDEDVDEEINEGFEGEEVE